jgi:hypothetical protein
MSTEGPRITPYIEGAKLDLSPIDGSGRLQYEMQVVRPEQGIPAAGVPAGGTVNFRFKPSGTRWWKPQDSYVRFRFRHLVNNALVSATNVTSLVPLVPASVIRGCSLEVAGTNIESHADLVAQTSAYMFRTSEQEYQAISGERNGWGSPYFAGNTALSDAPASEPARYRNAKVRASRSSYYEWQPPLAVFDYDNYLPSAEYRLSLDFDANFARRAVQPMSGTDEIIQKATASTAADGTVGTANLEIYFEILEVEFHACMVDFGSLGRYEGNIAIPLNCVQTQAIPLQATENSDVTVRVKPSSKKHTVAFQNAVARNGTSYANVSTLFAPTTATGAAYRLGQPPALAGAAGANTPFNILSLGMSYAGHVAPANGSLLLRYNTEEGDTMDRAYAEWERATGLEYPENYRTYLSRGPMFSFNAINVRDMSGRETDLNVRVTRAATGESDTLLVFSEYEQTLIMTIAGDTCTDAKVIDR